MPVDKTKITILYYLYKESTFYMLSGKHPLANSESPDMCQLKKELFTGFGANSKWHRHTLRYHLLLLRQP